MRSYVQLDSIGWALCFVDTEERTIKIGKRNTKDSSVRLSVGDERLLLPPKDFPHPSLGRGRVAWLAYHSTRHAHNDTRVPWKLRWNILFSSITFQSTLGTHFPKETGSSGCVIGKVANLPNPKCQNQTNPSRLLSPSVVNSIVKRLITDPKIRKPTDCSGAAAWTEKW